MSNGSDEKRLKFSKNFLTWVENRIRNYLLEINHRLANVAQTLRRHDSDIKILDENNRKLELKVDKLETSITELRKELNELRSELKSVRVHVSSVDEKAGSIEKLRSIIYAVWDVEIQKSEPKINEAELLIKAYRHLINVGPEKRSKVTKENISGLFRKRWTDIDI